MIEGDWVRNGVPAKLPIIPGHEIVGRVTALHHAFAVPSFEKADQVGQFAVDAVDLYWAAADTGDLMALPLVDGGTPNSLAPDVVALATDGTSVYFGHEEPGSLAKMPAAAVR